MTKKKQVTYTVAFDGWGKVINNVKVVVTGNPVRHFHLEKKGTHWQLLVDSASYFIRFGKDFNLRIVRENDKTKFIECPDGNLVPIKDLVQIHHTQREFYYLDDVNGDIRICLSASFIDMALEHLDLNYIQITMEDIKC